MSGYTARKLPCDVCDGRGQLWLRGSDYVECPNCEGTAVVEVITEVVNAYTQERYTPRVGGGLLKTTVVIHPRGGLLEVRA